MNANIRTINGPQSAASCMGEDFYHKVFDIMALSGIEAIKINRIFCGSGSILHVNINTFPQAPREIAAQGAVLKDAIAQLLSVINVASVVITPTDEELEGLTSTWIEATSNANNMNGGSAQDFAENSSHAGTGK